jgi:hypothetical protein
MADLPPNLLTDFAQFIETTKAQTAATLAAAVISASGRPWSIEQALDIKRDIQAALYPAPNHGWYKEWEKTKDARLRKVHGAQ